MGHSYRSIANLMGVNVKTAYKYVQSEIIELREQTRDDAEAVRDIEVERCDELIMGLWPGATAGDPQVVAAVIRVMERRARLLGLDAPAKIDMKAALITPEEASKLSDDEIQQRIAQLFAVAGSVAALTPAEGAPPAMDPAEAPALE